MQLNLLSHGVVRRIEPLASGNDFRQSQSRNRRTLDQRSKDFTTKTDRKSTQAPVLGLTTTRCMLAPAKNLISSISHLILREWT